jgi:hypothetical protein
MVSFWSSKRMSDYTAELQKSKFLRQLVVETLLSRYIHAIFYCFSPCVISCPFKRFLPSLGAAEISR